MSRRSLGSILDHVLDQELLALVKRDCANASDILEYLGESDRRRRFAELGYASTFRYCVEKLRMSEDMAFKRIRAARVCRRFPRILSAIEKGRLHLTGLVELAPYLRSDNWEGLVAAAAHKSRRQILELLAERFPKPDLPERVRAFEVRPESCQLAPGPVAFQLPDIASPAGSQVFKPQHPAADAGPASTPIESSAQRVDRGIGADGPMGDQRVTPEVPGVSRSSVHNAGSPLTARVTPLSSRRYGLQLTLPEASYAKLQQARELLSHAVPTGDLAEILGRALDALLEKLQKSRCGATETPRPSRACSSSNPRYVSARLRREVWARDGAQCTFVSDQGHRCASRVRLELDHVIPVAKGGDTSIGNLRLRCQAHNQLEAERAYGAGFMERRRKPGKREGTPPAA